MSNQTFGNSQGKPVGTVPGGFQSPGGQVWGFPERRGLCVESPAGAEELAGAEEIAGAMTIASVGCNI